MLKAMHDKDNDARDQNLIFLHNNDVYNNNPSFCEPVGGFHRFLTKIHSHEDKDPLILFSGDALSPSLESIRTHGKHMVMGLNSLGTHCAVLGNHEFDFGLENLEQFIRISNFPRLLSNITEAESGLPLAGSKTHHILEMNGIKMGLVGLVQDWLYQQQAVRKLRYQYRDYVEVGKRLA